MMLYCKFKLSPVLQIFILKNSASHSLFAGANFMSGSEHFLVMKNTFTVLKIMIGLIAVLIFLSGFVLTMAGAYDFILVIASIGETDKHHLAATVGIGLLQAVDLFLISIVLYVFSLGILMLFSVTESAILQKLPEWLRIKNFMELKVILWEAILTTLVVSYLAWLGEKRALKIDIGTESLLVPAGILLIALSLYFLKKGEK